MFFGKCTGFALHYEEEIISATTKERVFEGGGITLSCNYTGSYSSDSLLWYQQYPRSKPEFLLLITEAGLKIHNESIHPRLSVKLNEEKTHVDLEISSAEVTDSALYYCALRPTVTGNPETLYKNLTTHNILYNKSHNRKHFKHLQSKIKSRVGFLFRNKASFTHAAKFTLVKLTILPILDFGDVIYKIASNTLLSKLDAVYHSAIRFVTKAPYTTHHCDLYALVVKGVCFDVIDNFNNIIQYDVKFR
uniref:Ig-like domain-containing protein n=1 Tax=Oncorhynchus mykiss TaxID=8022 RepID=A0A8K9UG82_ONCMY